MRGRFWVGGAFNCCCCRERQGPRGGVKGSKAGLSAWDIRHRPSRPCQWTVLVLLSSPSRRPSTTLTHCSGNGSRIPGCLLWQRYSSFLSERVMPKSSAKSSPRCPAERASGVAGRRRCRLAASYAAGNQDSKRLRRSVGAFELGAFFKLERATPSQHPTCPKIILPHMHLPSEERQPRESPARMGIWGCMAAEKYCNTNMAMWPAGRVNGWVPECVCILVCARFCERMRAFRPPLKYDFCCCCCCQT